MLSYIGLKNSVRLRISRLTHQAFVNTGTPQSQERFAGPNSFGVPEPAVNYNNNEAMASSEAPLVVGGAPGGQREFSPMVQGEQQGAFANFNQRTPEMFGSQVSTLLFDCSMLTEGWTLYDKDKVN